jgi:hypothetical protein
MVHMTIICINNLQKLYTGYSNFDFFPLTCHVILNSFALGLGESCTASVSFIAWIFAGAETTPFVAKVPIQVSAGAVSELRILPVLSPQAIVCVRELVAIGIEAGHYVEINFVGPHVIFPVLHELLDHVGYRRW